MVEGGQRFGARGSCSSAEKVDVFLSMVVWQIKGGHIFLDPLPISRWNLVSSSVESVSFEQCHMAEAMSCQPPTPALKRGAASTSCS